MAARSVAAACHALRVKVRASASWLRGFCRRSPGASTSAAAFAAALLCAAAAAFPRAAASVLPLVASTSLCCAAAGLFAASERGAGASRDAVEAVVLVGGQGRRGRKAEAGLVQVIGEANASAYCAGGGVKVGCFLRRSAWRGVDEDGEEVVFAGTLAPSLAFAGGVERLGHGALEVEEEVAALRVDRLAEGMWNSYFGGWSTWHDVDAAL